MRLLDWVRSDGVDFARVRGDWMIILIKYGSDPFLTLSDVANFTTTAKPSAHLLSLNVKAKTVLFDKFTVASLCYGCGDGWHFKLTMTFKFTILPQSLNDMHRVASLRTTRFIIQSRVHTCLNAIWKYVYWVVWAGWFATFLFKDARIAVISC